ncbi:MULTISPECIES: large conductance mechanosensitive channel protein MscL [unclassified Actinobaculum]|uniref:large conductance mechanosensitive channel protein MscL n=1 Tax=unclassified Actinobaculum TaxID=2609299 RepID=UPI000D52973A|nr:MULTISPECIES: large conductance mechanosensitive channel protein MscL [unclassified Actinobaculum]AWE41683.1 large conductance mechanosensitive channel protein MscL [Actinobaculum sp. 313]RTE49302.1 large conductance mechanosensitive channel protein MscL [Actinobaculum sp. 352]
MLKGFKDFITRGNVVDMAVGIIIGGAFQPIVQHLVDYVIMPFVSGVFGKPNFNEIWTITFRNATIQPGFVVTALVNFLLIAAALYFFIVLPMNKFNERLEARKKAEDDAAAETPSDDVALLTEIRDLLARNGSAGATS